MGVPSSFFDRLKWGEDYLSKENQLVKNESITLPASKAKSYAYTSDTIYDERLADKVRGVDLLYHEATYLKDMEERAHKRFHCTTIQAATIARKAEVSRLILGHFSSKYELLEPFAEEAREVFPGAELAIEGVSYRV
jgi:ribonuclease Z